MTRHMMLRLTLKRASLRLDSTYSKFNALEDCAMTSSPDTLFENLKNEITAGRQRILIPGLAVGVWHDGLEQIAGFGVTSVEHPLPVTPDTLFQVGSISKTFTATALLMLMEAGKVDLDRPVCAYLPDFQLSDEDVAKRVTIKHLLTHTGGWRAWLAAKRA